MLRAVEAYYREFGARVRNARGSRSQTELAAASGLTRATIANLELGRYRARLDTLDRIARALGLDPASLLPSSPAQPEIGPDWLRPGDRRAVDRILARAGSIDRDAEG